MGSAVSVACNPQFSNTNCGIAHDLGILLMNSNCFAFFFSDIYSLCLFSFELLAVLTCFNRTFKLYDTVVVKAFLRFSVPC